MDLTLDDEKEPGAVIMELGDNDLQQSATSHPMNSAVMGQAETTALHIEAIGSLPSTS